MSFSSASLVDLLAARALVALCVDGGVDAAWEQMSGRIESPSWQETLKLALRFTLASRPNWACSSLTGCWTLRAPSRGNRFCTAACSWRRTRCGGVADERATVQRVVDGLASWMADGEAAGRSDAVDALFGLAGQSYAGQKVLELLGDGDLDEWTRQAAALLLGELGSGAGRRRRSRRCKRARRMKRKARACSRRH